MTGEPHPTTSLPAGQLAALADLTVLLEGYERLDGARVRPIRERAYHLGQLILRLREALAQRRSPRPLLVAIAAQAVQWAATLERPER